MELGFGQRVIRRVVDSEGAARIGRRQAAPTDAPNPFSSRSRPALAEILEGLFSSLLPPSFLRGRFAAFFCAGAAVTGGALVPVAEAIGHR